jgi:hypothetical protein
VTAPAEKYCTFVEAETLVYIGVLLFQMAIYPNPKLSEPGMIPDPWDRALSCIIDLRHCEVVLSAGAAWVSGSYPSDIVAGRMDVKTCPLTITYEVTTFSLNR